MVGVRRAYHFQHHRHGHVVVRNVRLSQAGQIPLEPAAGWIQCECRASNLSGRTGRRVVPSYAGFIE